MTAEEYKIYYKNWVKTHREQRVLSTMKWLEKNKDREREYRIRRYHEKHPNSRYYNKTKHFEQKATEF